MKNESKLRWTGGVAFEAELDGHKFNVDMSKEDGGNDIGPRPKKLLLPALAACSGVGVVGILKKMRVPEFSLNIEIEAETVKTHPRYYSKINMYYNFEGENLDGNKLKKAVSVSEERYCSVHLMLSKTARINSIININGERYL